MNNTKEKRRRSGNDGDKEVANGFFLNDETHKETTRGFTIEEECGFSYKRSRTSEYTSQTQVPFTSDFSSTKTENSKSLLEQMENRPLNIKDLF